MEDQPKYSIKTVSKLTGLSPYVIRAWEYRYNVLRPERTATNRRLYTDADVKKLQLLNLAVSAGISIGNAVKLSEDEIRNVINRGKDTVSEAKEGPVPEGREAQGTYLELCIDSIGRYDPLSLENLLFRASIDLSQNVLLEELIIPLIHEIGENWYNGEMRIAQEHMASSVLVSFLQYLRSVYKVPAGAPVTVIATPQGQMHELGALIIAAVAASEGWNVVYLGANLPASEIASAAFHLNAQVICLSIVYPDDLQIRRELGELHRLAGNRLIIAGGRASEMYQEVLDANDILLIQSISRFRSKLMERFRS